MICTESKAKCGQNGGENNRKGWSVRGPTPITSFLFDGASLQINLKGIFFFFFFEKYSTSLSASLLKAALHHLLIFLYKLSFFLFLLFSYI
jgi:hypothetical protein